jgi:hypothetical protein
MQYLLNTTKTWSVRLIFSFSLLALGGACSAVQKIPQSKKEIIQLGCKQDEGFVILYVEDQKLFPAQMPPGCRCFILLNGIEYVTTIGGSFSKCQEEIK